MSEILSDLGFFDRLVLVASAAIAPEQASFPLPPEKQRAAKALERAMRQTGTEPDSDYGAIAAWVWEPVLAEYLPAWAALSDEEQAVKVAEAALRLHTDTSTIRQVWLEESARSDAAEDWGREALVSWVSGMMTARVEAIMSHGITAAYAEQTVMQYFLEKTLSGELWTCGGCDAHLVAEYAPRPASGRCDRCVAAP
jgi:hypothetical protein